MMMSVCHRRRLLRPPARVVASASTASRPAREKEEGELVRTVRVRPSRPAKVEATYSVHHAVACVRPVIGEESAGGERTDQLGSVPSE